MNGNYLPETIREFVGTEKYTADKIGEYDSEVRIYEKYVLKIQPESPETENEYHIVNWLCTRLVQFKSLKFLPEKQYLSILECYSAI